MIPKSGHRCSCPLNNELPHLIANLGAMMCSNAAFASSPGEGRGRFLRFMLFWRTRLHRNAQKFGQQAIPFDAKQEPGEPFLQTGHDDALLLATPCRCMLYLGGSGGGR